MSLNASKLQSETAVGSGKFFFLKFLTLDSSDTGTAKSNDTGTAIK